MKKRILSAVLCSLMAASLLTACGGNGQSGGSSGSNPSSAADDQKMYGNYKVFDNVTLKYLNVWGAVEYSTDNRIAEEIRNRIGVSIEMEGSVIDCAEKMNLVFASGDMPDIINTPFWGGQDGCSVTVRKAGAEGQLTDISGLLPNYPNLAKAYEEGVASIQYLENELNHPSFNGAQYVLPWQLPGNANNETNWCYGLFVRQDVLDTLEVDPASIKTQDQLWDFMVKARDYGFKDVNGNDTIVASCDFNGCNTGDYIAGFSEKKLTGYKLDDNGNITTDILQGNDSWMDSYLYMWRMVKEGIMDKECFKHSAERASEKLGNGTCLIYSFQYNNAVTVTKQTGLYDAHPEMRYVPIGPLNYKDGQALVQTATDGRTGSPAFVFPKTCQNIDAALTYLDYINSEEGSTLVTYGFEGETFEYNEAGQPRMNAEWVEKYKADPTSTLQEMTDMGLNLLTGWNCVVDLHMDTWGETGPFQADAATEEVEEYKKMRPVERIQGYPLSAFEAGFDRLEDWTDLQAFLGEGEYAQRAYFAETEEEAKAILNEYRDHLLNDYNGVYEEMINYLNEIYHSRDDIAL